MLDASSATQLDQELFEFYSLEQLVELAGQSAALAINEGLMISGKNVLVVCGPGNNGADGLVVARYLQQFGANVDVWEPKRSNKTSFLPLLRQQLDLFDVTLLEENASLDFTKYELIVDALFGFSFKPPTRPPLDLVVENLANSKVPIVSIDVPSGWDVDKGPLGQNNIRPIMLVSLTIPKPCSMYLPEDCQHFLGGRFVPIEILKKYGISSLPYEGSEMIHKLN
ncbi:hypothetical protein P9112_004285 [Eukaryota sp. TZLM1-RC]